MRVILTDIDFPPDDVFFQFEFGDGQCGAIHHVSEHAQKHLQSGIGTVDVIYGAIEASIRIPMTTSTLHDGSESIATEVSRALEYHVFEEMGKPATEQMILVDRACGHEQLGTDDWVVMVAIENHSETIGECVSAGGATRKFHAGRLCLACGCDAIISHLMQRSILLGMVSAIFLLVIAAGGYWWMKQNRDDQQWVPMPLNPSSSLEDRAKLQQQIQAHLGREVFLKKIVADLSLSKRWNLTGEQQALERLKSSMFVRLGEVRNPMTQEVMATIDIGVKGKRKENPLLGEIATSMAKETREYLGIGQ